MGLDKATSNDNGKGADIFNDVNGMMVEIQGLLKKHVLAMMNDQEVKQNKDQFPRDQYINTQAIAAARRLKTAAESFNTGRENKLFRTANGGQGDPANAKEYSNFKKDVINGVKEVFPDKIDFDYKIEEIVLTREQNGKDSDFEKLKALINDINKIKNKTRDSMAMKSRLSDFSKASDQKGFTTWYEKMETDLKETFEALLAYVADLYELKLLMYKKLMEIREGQSK